jgi:hypothetical protein
MPSACSPDVRDVSTPSLARDWRYHHDRDADPMPGGDQPAVEVSTAASARSRIWSAAKDGSSSHIHRRQSSSVPHT